METLNRWTKEPECNKVIEIEDGSHIFYGKHDVYAQTVLEVICKDFLINPKV